MKLSLILAALALSAPVAHAGESIGFFDAQKVMVTSAEGKKNASDQAADLKAKQAEVTKAQEAAKKADAACTDGHGGRFMSAQCAQPLPEQTHSSELATRYQQELAQRQQTNAEKLAARINRVLPVVAKAKHLGAILPAGGAFYVGPALDVTAEIVRRLDAGDGKEPVAAVEDVATANARAEKAEERARAAEAELARVRKLGLKATDIAKTAIGERDKAVAVATEAVDLSRRVLGSDDPALTKPAAPTVPPPPPTQPIASKGKK